MISQLQILQKMGGVRRLEQAFKLSDFTLELATKNIIYGLGKRSRSRRVVTELNKRLTA